MTKLDRIKWTKIVHFILYWLENLYCTVLHSMRLSPIKQGLSTCLTCLTSSIHFHFCSKPLYTRRVENISTSYQTSAPWRTKLHNQNHIFWTYTRHADTLSLSTELVTLVHTYCTYTYFLIPRMLLMTDLITHHFLSPSPAHAREYLRSRKHLRSRERYMVRGDMSRPGEWAWPRICASI